MEVPSVTMGALLTQYGVLHYLKIDIEGMDRECLRSIDPSKAPQYISLELSHSEDIIGGLQELSYNRFKIVNKGTFTSSLPIFPKELDWRFLRKMRLGSLVPMAPSRTLTLFPQSMVGIFPRDAQGHSAKKPSGHCLRLTRRSDCTNVFSGRSFALACRFPTAGMTFNATA